MEKVLTPVLNNSCTGCGSCYNACPKNAITMRGDEFGFYKPVIDNEKCVNCGLCEKVCPIDKFNSTNENAPKVFALQINDEKQLYKSASGGAFAVIAKEVISQGGVVYGVIYDDEMKVCHSRTETFDGLEKMYSSKYVQSNTKTTFKQAKEDLENEKTVLFSGTPCQIAGLKSYLRKDYQNLLTIDLVCHGVPSPKVFEIYKQEFMKNKPDETLLNVNFRSKKAGWGIHYLIHYTTITTTLRNYHKPKDFWVYIMNYIFNTSCGNCKFNKNPRVADISIGDFWGVDEYDKSLNNDKGLSILLINNEKGAKNLKVVQDKCRLQEVPYDVAIKRNPNIKQSSIAEPNREQFLEDVCIKNISLKKTAKKYLRVPLHIAIYRLLPQFAKDFIKYKILKMEKKS